MEKATSVDTEIGTYEGKVVITVLCVCEAMTLREVQDNSIGFNEYP